MQDMAPYVHEEVKGMNYELVYIINPTVEEEARKELIARFNGMIETNEVQQGTINIGIVDSQGIIGDGNVALLTFDVLGTQGTSSPMDVVVRGAFGTDLKNVANNVAGGTITVGPPGSAGGAGKLPLPAGVAVAAVCSAFWIAGRRAS